MNIQAGMPLLIVVELLTLLPLPPLAWASATARVRAKKKHSRVFVSSCIRWGLLSFCDTALSAVNFALIVLWWRQRPLAVF